MANGARPRVKSVRECPLSLAAIPHTITLTCTGHTPYPYPPGRHRYAELFSHINVSGFKTETYRVLCHGSPHADFVHVDGELQDMFDAFLRQRGWMGYLEGYAPS